MLWNASLRGYCSKDSQLKKTLIMILTNPELTKKSKTLESRIIKAISDNDNIEIFSLMAETESLYKQEYINKDDYNFLTDIELIKEINL